MYVSREVRGFASRGWRRWSRKGEEEGGRWLGSHCTMPSPERPPLHPLDMHFLPPTIPHELLPRFYDILCRSLLLLTLIHTRSSLRVYRFLDRVHSVCVCVCVCRRMDGWTCAHASCRRIRRVPPGCASSYARALTCVQVEYVREKVLSSSLPLFLTLSPLSCEFTRLNRVSAR